ncbi:hypothetical protein [Nocardia speluncae]|uniref:hypothetical protein n=1 Tax=Nocardia speluncae TaxID=419477 RepID=UPI001FE2305E|nr:hypothetical protein [Nocardia speluncae]
MAGLHVFVEQCREGFGRESAAVRAGEIGVFDDDDRGVDSADGERVVVVAARQVGQAVALLGCRRRGTRRIAPGARADRGADSQERDDYRADRNGFPRE